MPEVRASAERIQEEKHVHAVRDPRFVMHGYDVLLHSTHESSSLTSSTASNNTCSVNCNSGKIHLAEPAQLDSDVMSKEWRSTAHPPMGLTRRHDSGPTYRARVRGAILVVSDAHLQLFGPR